MNMRTAAVRTAGAVLIFLLYRTAAHLLSSVIPTYLSSAIASVLSSSLCFALSRSGKISVVTFDSKFEAAKINNRQPPDTIRKNPSNGNSDGKQSFTSECNVLHKNTVADVKLVCFNMVVALAVLFTFEGVVCIFTSGSTSSITFTDAAVSMTVYPFFEELLFRGAMLRMLLPPECAESKHYQIFAVSVQALLFAAAHTASAAPTALLAGMVFGLLSVSSGKGGVPRALPGASVLTHAVYNGAVCLAGALPDITGLSAENAAPLVAFAGAAAFSAAALILKIKRST